MIWPHIWFLGGWNWIRYNDIINQNVFESYNRRNLYSAYFILKITHKTVNYRRIWLTFNFTICCVRSVTLRCCDALIVLLWCRRAGCCSGFLITAHSFLEYLHPFPLPTWVAWKWCIWVRKRSHKIVMCFHLTHLGCFLLETIQLPVRKHGGTSPCCPNKVLFNS